MFLNQHSLKGTPISHFISMLVRRRAGHPSVIAPQQADMESESKESSSLYRTRFQGVGLHVCLYVGLYLGASPTKQLRRQWVQTRGRAQEAGPLPKNVASLGFNIRQQF